MTVLISFDDCGAGVHGTVHVWSEYFLYDRYRAYDLCILQDVFPKNISEVK